MTEIDQERLVTLVLAELAKQGHRCQLGAKKALAVFCGGMIGLDDAILQMQQLQQEGYQFEVVLTPNADTVIGQQKLRDALGPVPIYTEACDHHETIKKLAESDVVIIPVMTINTAAKVGNGIADNLATTLITVALLSGKPVIGVRDACEPQNQYRQTMGQNKAAQAYRALLAANVEKLREYGMELCGAQALAITVQRGLNEPVPAAAATREEFPIFAGKILSVADLPGSGGRIHVSPRTIITPAAKDAIKERGIEVIIS